MIYFIRAGQTDQVKIGWSKNEETLKRRVSTLQTGQAHRLVVIRTLEADRWAEAWLHGFFAGARMSGEWFAFDKEMLTIEPSLNEPTGFLDGLTQCRVALTMPVEEREALDRYCAERRRATGEPIARADVIRQAIRNLVEGRC